MPKHSKEIQEVLDVYINNMDKQLAINAIEQFGGEQAFIDVHKGVCQKGIQIGVSGWIEDKDLKSFYDANKKNILSFVKLNAKDFGYPNMCDMVRGFTALNDKLDCDEVAEAIYDSENTNHMLLTTELAGYVGEELARCYESFLEDTQ